MKRLQPENRNPTKRCGPHSVPTKVCPCCKVEKGIRSFARMAKFCHDCRIAPSRPKLEGPTLTQREDARARAEVARFNDFAAQVRAAAGVPRSSSSELEAVKERRPPRLQPGRPSELGPVAPGMTRAQQLEHVASPP